MDCRRQPHSSEDYRGAGTDPDEYTEEERDIIGKEAARLRWQFEEERGKKSRGDAMTAVAEAGCSSSMAMLADLDRQVKEAMGKKQESLRELRQLQLQLKAAQPPRPHAPAKHSNFALPDPCRRQQGVDWSEQHLLEMKVEAAGKELRSLEERIESGRRMYDNQLGLNTAEVMAVMEERDSLKRKLADGGGGGALGFLERMELERQVNLAKEQLLAEQKTSRTNLQRLQEELEESNRIADEYQASCSELSCKVEQLERELTRKTEEEASREDELRGEVRALRHEMEERKAAEHRLSLDAADKEKANLELQQMLLEKEKQLSAEHEARVALCRENTDHLLQLKSDGATELRNLTASLQAESKAALAALEASKDQQLRQLSERNKSEIADLKAVHCKVVENYSHDIETLRKALMEQERQASELARNLKMDFEKELKSAVQKERALNEEEVSRLLSREKNNFEDELRRVSCRLTEAAEYEKRQAAEERDSKEELKREVERLREKSKDEMREVLAQHAAALDHARKEHMGELEGLQQRLRADRETEVGRVCGQLEQTEAALKAKAKELAEYSESVNHFFHAFDHHEKTIVAELNDLCRKLAEALQIDPRKVTCKQSAGGASALKPHQLLLNPALQKTITRNCLANLRATVTDLLGSYGQSQEALLAQADQLKAVKKEAERQVLLLTDHMALVGEKEKASVREEMEEAQAKVVSEMQQAMDSLGTECAQLRKKNSVLENEVDALHRSMAKWKEETANKLSQTFEAEVRRSLYLKRRAKEEQEATDMLNKQKLLIKLEDQVSKLKSEQAMDKVSASDPTTNNLINHLQDRIRLLRLETNSR